MTTPDSSTTDSSSPTSKAPAGPLDASPAQPTPAAAARPARAAAAPRTPKDTGADATPGTLPRWTDRRHAAPLAKIGMAVFAVGLASVAVSLVLFATGRTDLPLWINLISMLAPVGLGIGLIGVVKEARAASPALAARKLEKESAKAKAAGDPSEEWNLPDLAASEKTTDSSPRN